MKYCLAAILVIAVGLGGDISIAAEDCDQTLSEGPSRPSQASVWDELELEAMAFLRRITVYPDERVIAVQKWANGIAKSQNEGRNLGVLEHATLQIILRSQKEGLLEGVPSETIAVLRQSLASSWRALTGSVPDSQELTSRTLPNEVLNRQRTNLASFARLATQIGGKDLIVHDSTSTKLAKKLFPLTLATFGLTAGFAFAQVAVPNDVMDLLVSSCIGLSVGLITEHIFHGKIMHGGFGGKRLPKIYQSRWMPSFIRRDAIKQANFHAAHHSIATKSNYVVDEEGVPVNGGLTREEILARLETLGVDEPTRVTFDKDTKLGLHSEPKWISLFAHTAPVAMILAYFAGENPFLSTFVAGFVSQAWLYNIYWFHGIYHWTVEKSQNHVHRITRWYLSTPFFRRAYLHHFQHHANTRSNFQLFPLAPVDTLFGTESELNLHDLLLALEQDLNF